MINARDCSRSVPRARNPLIQLKQTCARLSPDLLTDKVADSREFYPPACFSICGVDISELAGAALTRTFPRSAGEGGAKRRMGVPRGKGLPGRKLRPQSLRHRITRLRGTPIPGQIGAPRRFALPSGTFPRGAGEGIDRALRDVSTP